MGSYTENDALTYIYRELRDTASTADQQLLTNTELTGFIRAAERRYSLDRPRLVAIDANADGTAYYALPSGFEQGFSRLDAVEHPAGQDPASLRDPREWTLYQAPAGLTLRWLDGKPASGTSVRLTYTAARSYNSSAASTTVLDTDHYAVCDLAAGYAALAIAAKYARTSEPIINADVVNYRSKADEWTRLGKSLGDRYAAHMRLGAEAAAQVGPAGGFANWDQGGSDGHDRLWHRRGLR